MVGMTYWRKGGEEPPRRASAYALTSYGGQVRNWWRRCSAPDLPRRFCRGFCLSKASFSCRKIFYDLRLDLRFVCYNGCELGDGH